MKIDGVILDVDGTLWDSTGVVAGAWTQAARDENLGLVVTREMTRAQFGKTMKIIARNLFGELPEERRDRLLESCCRYEQEALEKDTADLLYPGVHETLAALAKEYRLFIVSNCQAGYIELFLEKNGLAPLVTDFECYGNNGNEKGPNIRLVAERNGLSSPVYVGDTEGDREASDAAGVPFVWASYGFGEAKEYAAKIGAFSGLPGVLKTFG